MTLPALDTFRRGLHSFHFSRPPISGECGLACLAIALNLGGQAVTLDELAAETPTDATGLNLAELKTAAENRNLNAEGYRANIEALWQVDTPCILHWKQDHYVYLHRVAGEDLGIFDPALTDFDGLCPEVLYSKADMEARFGGVLLMLTASPGQAAERRSQD